MYPRELTGNSYRAKEFTESDCLNGQLEKRMIRLNESKTQPISKQEVWAAFKKVRSKGGSPGVDGITIEKVGSNPRKYLYPVWNRLASGSYHPPSVKQVSIPKFDGGIRLLGIPTVTDRVAQMVIREQLEPIVEPTFSTNSFGYRPRKSAHQAVEQCKQNCMIYDWVIDLDIKGFFDNIDHELMLKALGHHTNKKHILLYVERWLKAEIQTPEGIQRSNEYKGTPQGGVISPLLANIFMDIVFDKWIEKHYPELPFERYADDVIVHCRDFKQALRLLEQIKIRLRSCKLEVNKRKTRIVYCKRNQKKHPPFKVKYHSFDFLGFTFKTRRTRGKWGHLQMVFTPSMSQKAINRVVDELGKLRLHRKVHLHIADLANLVRAKVSGWIRYFGKVNKTGLKRAMRHLNLRLIKWVINKYRRFRRKPRVLAWNWLRGVYQHFPNLFTHWQYGFRP
jgi:RNA-directed DNA polymerase